MTVADAPKPGRAKSVPERFEVFESDSTAHLTEEQKSWKVVKLRPASERFAVLTPIEPVAQLPVAAPPGDADQIEVAAADLVAAVRRLLALGTRPETVVKAVADVLAGERG